MRWPLRFQILLPFTVLVLGTVAVVSALDAYLSARRHRDQVQGQLRNIAATLSPGTFPLTGPVLKQTHGLSGAHFVVATPAGEVLAASDAELTSVPQDARVQNPLDLTLGDAVDVGGSRFMHAVVKIRPRYGGAPAQQLHILYPEHTWTQAWRETVYPPLVTGAVALLLAAAVSALIAAGVSRPIARLRHQAEQIATGDFQALPEPQRNDEIRDLVRAVNRMATMLAHYEEQMRRDERLKALGQLRGGLAHQLRNAVTGCRMALDLHRLRNEKQNIGDAESLDVAHRQLMLIEKHLEQFLRFGARDVDVQMTVVDVNRIAAEALPLMLPAAEHAHVRLESHGGDQPAWVRGDAAALEQVLINLLLNAIDAVRASRSKDELGETGGTVRLSVSNTANHVRMQVSDDGPGPSEEIRHKLFDALATDKPGGTGLGLAASRDIVTQHHGRLHWHREDGWTHFTVELPAADAVAPMRQQDESANCTADKAATGGRAGHCETFPN